MPALLEETLDAIDAAEVHWSTSTILAVFFAASLISAVFFGLGYTLGRGGTPKPAVGIASSGTAAPAAASTFAQGAQNLRSAPPVHAAFRQASVAPPAHAPAVAAKAGRPVPVAARAKAAASASSAAHFMVQVGAIGSRRDARMLVSQLRKSGFHAAIYPGRHDKYLHVQIGPFATTEQANTMRHRVAASGYRAILKRAS